MASGTGPMWDLNEFTYSSSPSFAESLFALGSHFLGNWGTLQGKVKFLVDNNNQSSLNGLLHVCNPVGS
jgi:hypothetical protein